MSNSQKSVIIPVAQTCVSFTPDRFSGKGEPAVDLRDFFVDELWPLLDEAQKRELIEIAEWLSRYAPPQNNDEQADNDD